MARLEARPFDEGLVVIVGAGGAGQDPHEVAVVAQVLQQAGHPPVQRREETRLVCMDHQEEAWSLQGEVAFPLAAFIPSENLRRACKLRVIMGKN